MLRDPVLPRVAGLNAVEQREAGRAGAGHPHQSGIGAARQRIEDIGDCRQRGNRRRRQVVATASKIPRIERAAINLVPRAEYLTGRTGLQRVDQKDGGSGHLLHAIGVKPFAPARHELGLAEQAGGHIRSQ